MKNVSVFLADGFEEIEALTVVDLLRRAGIKVTTISITDDPTVRGTHDIKVIADSTFAAADFSAMDMLVLPGGLPGTTNLGNFQPLCELLKEFNASGKLVSAICAAPTVFGKLGIVNGRKATCYPGCEGELTGAKYLTDTVVTDGNITTSRGPSTAIPFALAIIERLLGTEASDKVAAAILLK